MLMFATKVRTFLNVGKDNILHIGDMALYHISNNIIETEIEMSQYFKSHTFKLDTLTEKNVRAAPQRINLEAFDREIRSVTSDLPSLPFFDLWSKPDSVLSLGILGIITIGFLFGVCVFCRLRLRGRKKNVKTKNIQIGQNQRDDY